MNAVILLLEREQHIEQTIAPAAHEPELPPERAQRVPRVAQRAAHGRRDIRHQAGHALLRCHRQLQHQNTDKHTWRVQITPPAPVKGRHTNHHAVALLHPREVQRKGSQKKNKYASFVASRLLTQQGIGGTLQWLHQRVGPRQNRVPRSASTAIQQCSRQLRDMTLPVRRVARERV